MKLASLSAVLGAATLAGVAFPVPSIASDDHKVLMPNEVKWSPGPASIPKGAEVAVLFGDPSKEGPFAMRLKMPKGYQIAPHSHPKPEVVTVISGTFRIGMGENADPSKAQALPAGGFFAFPPGMVHYASTDEDTVVQLNSIGPWGLNYVNPKDDPRQKTQ
jgi:quercetin dioxygenase-like cupin family protein